MDSALMVIDMQNLFCHPEGTVTKLVGPLHAVEDAVAGVTAAIAEARRSGRHIVYTRHVYDAQYHNAGRNFFGQNPMGPTGADLAEHGAFIAGTWDSDILEVIAPRAEDVVIDKTRYDAFLGTPLESVLHGKGVTDLYLCGVVTNICVESTARTAFMKDFRCTVYSDATTAGTRELHDAALLAIERGCFATVLPLGALETVRD